MKAGTPLEIRLRSDDTAHGFPSSAPTSNVELPKRGAGVATVTFTPKAGRYTFECSQAVRRRPRVHARLDRRERVVHGCACHACCGSASDLSGRRSWSPCSRSPFASALLPRSCGRPCPATRCPASPRCEFEEFRLGLDDFLEVETAGRRARARLQRHELRRVPQRAGDRRRRHDRRDARRPARRERAVRDARRHRRDALPPVLDPDARLSAHRAGGRQRVRAPRADSAVRRRARRGDSRRDAARARGSDRSRPRRRVAAARRASSTSPPASARIGRFGWKAQHATLLAFGADAYRNEMGITNDIFSREVAFGVSAERMRVCDPIPDPEDIRDPRTRPPRHRQLRELHAVPRAGGARRLERDRRASASRCSPPIGCATCHVPALTTGPSANPLFDRKPVPLFSDLLLHDVGTGDGIVQGHGGGERDPDARRSGGCGCAGRCCTTARRRRSKTPSAGTPARPISRAGVSTI